MNSFSNGVGSVLSKNISSNDVTEEYTDVSIKLANKKYILKSTEICSKALLPQRHAGNSGKDP